MSKLNLTCPFAQAGCNATFNSEDDWSQHVANCFKGVLLSCRVPECRSGSQALIFTSPRDLIDHAVAVHNCLPWSHGVTEKANVTFPGWFLRPTESNFAAIMIKRLAVKLDDVEVVVGLMGLVRENALDGSPTKLFLVPVQMSSVNSTNNHLIQLKVQMTGANDVIIPHFGRWNPWMEDELPQGSTMNSSCKLTVNDFKSAIDFHQNFEMHSIASFSRDRILSAGITIPNMDSVSVNITARLEIVRCVVGVNTIYSDIREFATGWDEIGSRDTIRSTVDDPDKKMPSTATRILFPQLVAKRNLLIESLYESQIMNAIGPLILDSLMFENTPPNQPTPCKLLVIMPSRTYIEGAIEEWNKWAAMKKLEIYQMVHAKYYVVDQFKIHGGHVVMTTFSALDDIVNLEDGDLWSLMTNELRNIHVHLPSCFPYPLANDVFCKFVARMGERIKLIQRTMFDYHISESLSSGFFSHLFQGGAIQLSLGENPIGFLKRSISFVKPEFGQSNVDLAIRLIEMDGEASKRWVIFVNETVGPQFEILKTELCTKFPTQRVTIFGSEEIVRDNPNHFLPFLLHQDGILVAPFSSLGFAELAAASRVIVYDRPNDLVDLIRVAASFKRTRQRLTTIYVVRHAPQ